jgi:hypothetical protein
MLPWYLACLALAHGQTAQAFYQKYSFCDSSVKGTVNQIRDARSGWIKKVGISKTFQPTLCFLIDL